MNETIDLLQKHRSYRQFDESYELPKKDLQAILNAARQAPSWMNGQFYSILVIKDPHIREKMVALNPGNPHIAQGSIFLLFLADLKRSAQIAQHHSSDFLVDQGLDSLLIATTDTSLALENAIIAAESLGLGTVPVGSVRNHLNEYKEWFHLPDYVLPIAGLSIGRPTVEMSVKPRLPEPLVVHYDTYKDVDYPLLEQYDDIMEQFGEARETKRWTKKFSDFFQNEPNKKTDLFLKSQRLIK